MSVTPEQLRTMSRRSLDFPSQEAVDFIPALSTGPDGPTSLAPVVEREQAMEQSDNTTCPTGPLPTTETQEQTLTRLAALSPVDYARCRNQEAERLSVAKKFLDQAIRDRQRQVKTKRPGQGHALELDEVVPSDGAVDGVALVWDLESTFARYLWLPPGGALACTLWVFRAHAHDCFDFNPRLAALSPERGCGKTTLMDLVARLVPRPLCTSNITPAAIFRVIEAGHPTLFLDEMDSFQEAHEQLRGILNSGHTRASATVVRTVGDNHEPRRFSTWCPMMFAAIGRLPNTLEDRSIVIPMQRCTKAEHKTLRPLFQSGKRGAAIRDELQALSSRVARWVLDHADSLQDGDPLLPDTLGLRALDNWGPLLTIATLISEETAIQARQAALALSGHPDQHGETAGVQLLEDIRAIVHDKGVDQIGSQALCDALAGLEESPWGDWKQNKPITPVQLAKLLKPFGISSRNLKQPDGTVLKGYALRDLLDSFGRYLGSCVKENGVPKRYPATFRSSINDSPLLRSATEGIGSGSQSGQGPALVAQGSPVAFQDDESHCAYEKFLWEGAEEVDADAS